MAGDTRDKDSLSQPPGATPGENVPPPHVGTPNKVYEIFQGPPESANALPEGSGQNTAGSKPPVARLSDAVKTLRVEDIKQVYMYPCVRESLLYGIGGGFGVGGVRALWGGK
jgi:cytochrome c oxidase assembly protein subunit 20